LQATATCVHLSENNSGLEVSGFSAKLKKIESMLHNANISKLFTPTYRLALYFKKKAMQMKEAGKIKREGRKKLNNANSNN